MKSLPAIARSSDLAIRWLPALGLAASLSLTGCGTVIAVADTAGTVVATTVKAGVEVVSTAVDVTTSGVRAVVGSSDKK